MCRATDNFCYLSSPCVVLSARVSTHSSAGSNLGRRHFYAMHGYWNLSCGDTHEPCEYPKTHATQGITCRNAILHSSVPFCALLRSCVCALWCSFALSCLFLHLIAFKRARLGIANFNVSHKQTRKSQRVETRGLPIGVPLSFGLRKKDKWHHLHGSICMGPCCLKASKVGPGCQVLSAPLLL